MNVLKIFKQTNNEIENVSKNKIRNRLNTVLSKVSLQARLLILFIAVLVISINVVGISSYLKAKEATITSMENRLSREAELMAYTAENLKFYYISDDNYFKQQLEISVRNQHKQLNKDGIESDIFYFADDMMNPFKVSKDSNINISEELKSAISSRKILNLSYIKK